jgi:hypothetical protein
VFYGACFKEGITVIGRVSGKGLEKHYLRKRCVRIVGMSLGGALAVLLSVALVLGFNPRICLFDHGFLLGDIAFYAALSVIPVILILACALIPKETESESVFPEESRYEHYYTADQPVIKVIRWCVAASILCYGFVMTALYVMKAATPALPTVTVAIMLLCVIPFAAYFVPEVAERIADCQGRLHMMLGCVGLLLPFLCILNGYFDKSYTIASQYKNLELICFVTLMLAVVYDVRDRLDGTRRRTRLAFMLICFALCFGFSVARMVMMITVGAVGYADTCVTFMLFAVSLYFGARCFFYEEQ